MICRVRRPRFFGGAVLAFVFAFGATSARAAESFLEMVPMSDGVRLATAVTLPRATGGPWPVIVARTPYTEFGPNAGIVDQALSLVAGLGFVAVLQDTRGAGQSEGESRPFLFDRSDGLDTVAWVIAQPWCNGKVAMVGASAVGIPAYLMAPEAPPEMRCQAVLIATPDVFTTAYQGGVFKQSDATSWASWVGVRDMVAELMAHRDCDTFWDTVRMTPHGAGVRAAGLHIGGYYDLFAEGTIAAFQMYQQADDPWARDHQYLVLGPWSHHEVGQPAVGELRLPPQAAYDFVADLIYWIQFCAAGSSPVVRRWAPVRYYVMGDVDDPTAPGNEWRTAATWPPVPTDPTPLFLTPALGLAAAAPGDGDALAVPFDPNDPSPTVGGRNLAIPAGPRDQAPRVEARADALVFTSAPLDEPLEVTGRVAARLFVAVDGPDADVVVRLTDVYPDGRSLLINDGVVRLSRRAGCATEVPVVPGEVMEVEVDLESTSLILNRGHRLRATVTGSNYPRFETNPAVVAAGTPVTITVFVGGDHPSRLILPVPSPLPEPPEPGPEVVEVPVVADAPGAETADVAEGPGAVEPGADAGGDVPAVLEPFDPRPDAAEPTETDAPPVDAVAPPPADVPLPDVPSVPDAFADSGPAPGGGGGGGCGTAPAAAPAAGFGWLGLLGVLGWGAVVQVTRRGRPGPARSQPAHRRRWSRRH